MKIGFDTRMITHPGIGRYIRSLLFELVRQAPGEEFVLFGNEEALEKFVQFQNVDIVPWNAPIYSIQEQINPPYSKAGLDLLHVPHFNIPFFYSGKMVVTVHDLIYLLFPEAGISAVARCYARYMMGRVMQKADKVVSVSHYTKKDLVNTFGEKCQDKIMVIYEASSDKFNRVDDESFLDNIKLKYGLKDNILLYVGSIKPHKNVETLLRVFSELKKRNIPCQLVIAGKWDKKEGYLKTLMNKEDIVYINEISSADLVGLYTIANVLVHLSLYEGFGLTLLEAMQCGLPVVASERTSLPEIAADAAKYVSPLDIGQITDTVYNVLVNRGLREMMINSGYKRAAQFSWQKTAAETIELYRSVV